MNLCHFSPATAPSISTSEKSLTKPQRCIPAQLRTNNSPLLSYLHKVNVLHHQSPLCPLTYIDT